MLVQLAYGILTGSLGLLSDSIHMFFDCLALVVGLCAAVMSKWPPNARFPYGYGKVDTLSGFANGIFLMCVFTLSLLLSISNNLQDHQPGDYLRGSGAAVDG
jgi:zinc transporter 5/7